MSKLQWDGTGEKLYENGVEKGVLYPYSENAYQKGVAWNGLTAINQSPSGGEITTLYADDQEYANMMSLEKFGLTVEAYTYPEEFEACDGSAELEPGVTFGQQNRQMFGLSYQTKIGNDTDGFDHGYIIHLVYGCRAKPSERNYSTINDSPEAITLSWELSCTPVDVAGHKPTAHIAINSNKLTPEKLAKLEALLYGTDAGAEGTPAASDSKLPLPSELVTLLAN